MVTPSLHTRVGEWVNIPAFLAIALWGSTFVIVKVTVRDHLSPLSLAAMRVALSAAVLFVALWAVEKDWKVDRKDLPLLALLGFSGMALFQIFFIEGLKRTTAGNSSVVAATSSIFAVITVALFRVEDLRWKTIAGIILALSGVALVAQREGLSLGTESGLLGDIFTLIAAMGWGVFVAVQMPLFKRYSPLKIMTWASIFGSIFILPFTGSTLLAEDWGSLSLTGWGLAIYYVIVSGFAATILWSRGVRNWGPSKTSVYSYLNPVFGILSGVVLLGERLVAVQIAGVLAVFVGLALARK